MKIPVHKTVALVLALAKLHNYRTDENEARCDVAYSSAIDEWRNELTGAVPLVETTHQQHTDASSTTDTVTPRQLLDGATISMTSVSTVAAIDRDGTITSVGVLECHFHAIDCTRTFWILV